MSISALDLSILVVYLAGVVAFGVWIGRGQRDATDYLLGGRDLPWFAVLLSIVATETSTVTFLSVPGLPFAEGGDMTFLQLAIGYVIGRLIVIWLLMPLFFEGKLFTSYEVLHRRFGGATKQTASLMFLVTRNAADGLRLYLTAIVLQQVLGWSLVPCVFAMGVATIIYTLFGGLKSVVWNDCIQFVVYMTGGILALWVIVEKLPGGWEQLMQFASDPQINGGAFAKSRVLDFSWDFRQSYTFWAGTIGGVFVTLGSHGTDQLMVQRYLAARSRRDAGLALGFSGVIILLQFAFFLFLGIALAAFYASGATGAAFQKTDKVFAAFIVDHMPIGVIGVTLAAVFSAAMSTLSSSLSSSASAAVNDFYRSLRGVADEQKLLFAGRLATVAFGLIQIGVALLGPLTQQAVVDSVMTIQSVSIGVILGLFLLALTGVASQRAALCGLIVGLATVCAVAFNSYVLPAAYTYTVGWPWLAVVGSMTVLVTGKIAQGTSGRDSRRSFPGKDLG